MNVLMVGSGKGSFEMRGVQLGAAIGARVTSAPTSADWQWADLVVLVKRAAAAFCAQAHAAGVPIVWDAVDFWSQPYDNTADETRAKALLAAQIAAIRPVLTIGSTQAMAAACGGAYLPHHSWRGLIPVQPREHVSQVGYQGNPVYLGRWRAALIKACTARGWQFVTIGQDVKAVWEADILVSFRDGPWDGWMCREWKSGVKLANAIAAGRPIVTQPSAAAREIAPPGWTVDAEPMLDHAFDALTTRHARSLAYDACVAAAPPLRLPAIAEQFRALLTSARTTCPA